MPVVKGMGEVDGWGWMVDRGKTYALPTTYDQPSTIHLQNVLAQVAVLYDALQLVADELGVDRQALVLHAVRHVEEDVFEERRQDRVQAAGAAVLDLGGDLGRDPCAL